MSYKVLPKSRASYAITMKLESSGKRTDRREAQILVGILTELFIGVPRTRTWHDIRKVSYILILVSFFFCFETYNIFIAKIALAKVLRYTQK